MFVQASTPSLFLCSKTVRSARLFFLKSVVTPSSSANFNYPPSFLFAERRKGKSTDEIEGRKRYISTNILFDREGRHCSADSESVSLRQTCEHWQVQSVSDTHTGRPRGSAFLVWETQRTKKTTTTTGDLSIDDLLLTCFAWLPGRSVAPPPVSVRPFQAVFPPAFGGGGLAASELLLLNACLLAFFSHAAFAIPAASTFGPGHGVWNWGIGGGGLANSKLLYGHCGIGSRGADFRIPMPLRLLSGV